MSAAFRMRERLDVGGRGLANEKRPVDDGPFVCASEAQAPRGARYILPFDRAYVTLMVVMRATLM